MQVQDGVYRVPRDAAERLRRVTRSTPAAELRDIVELRHDPALAREGYELQVARQGILLRYGSELGRLWGLRTLEQIARESERASGAGSGSGAGAASTSGPGPGSDAGAASISAPGKRADRAQELPIPLLTISDEPDYPYRGVMLDVSRTRVPKMETLYWLVDQWSQAKINHLQLYLEHTFAYAGHERVWQDASPFTAEQIRALRDYCFERGIELWLEGRRMGDLRRWAQAGVPGELQPLEDPSSSEFTGLQPKPEGGLCYPIPDSELETNPDVGG